MSNIVRRAVQFLNLLSPAQSGPDLATSLAAIAMIQARFVAGDLRNNVVPALPSSQRTFPAMMARRLETGDIFRQDCVGELEALMDMLRREIDGGADVSWEADEHHVCGGYEVVCYDARIVPLVDVVNELDDLRHALLATISAAQAIQSVEDLLAS